MDDLTKQDLVGIQNYSEECHVMNEQLRRCNKPRLIFPHFCSNYY